MPTRYDAVEEFDNLIASRQPAGDTPITYRDILDAKRALDARALQLPTEFFICQKCGRRFKSYGAIMGHLKRRTR